MTAVHIYCVLNVISPQKGTWIYLIMFYQDRQKIITAQEFTVCLFSAKQQMQNKSVFLDRF